MTATEGAVVLVGLFAGYWIVSRLFTGMKERSSGPTEQRAREREDQWRSEPPPTSDPHAKSWSEVLGVSSSACVEEIKRAYKTQIIQYHADKVASLGRELQELAATKSKEITTAYQEGMHARGFIR